MATISFNFAFTSIVTVLKNFTEYLMVRSKNWNANFWYKIVKFIRDTCKWNWCRLHIKLNVQYCLMSPRSKRPLHEILRGQTKGRIVKRYTSESTRATQHKFLEPIRNRDMNTTSSKRKETHQSSTRRHSILHGNKTVCLTASLTRKQPK